MLLARVAASKAGISDHESLETAFNLPSLAQLVPGMPIVKMVHDDVPHWRRPQELESSKEEFRGSRVIFLVRDPRDVIVSLYFELSRRLASHLDRERMAVPENLRSRVKPFEGTLEEFLNQDVGGFETIIRYFNVWALNRTIPNAFLLLRYEDLHTDAAGQLRRLVDFLTTCHFSDGDIQRAVEFSRFENMHQIEANGRVAHFALTAPNPSDTASFKTRRGVVQGFMDYLTEEQVDRLTLFMNSNLSPFFGY
jgi:hypothetical protein